MIGGRSLFMSDEELLNQVIRVFCRVCIESVFIITIITVTALLLTLLLVMLVDNIRASKVSQGSISA